MKNLHILTSKDLSKVFINGVFVMKHLHILTSKNLEQKNIKARWVTLQRINLYQKWQGNNTLGYKRTVNKIVINCRERKMQSVEEKIKCQWNFHKWSLIRMTSTQKERQVCIKKRWAKWSLCKMKKRYYFLKTGWDGD